MKFLKIKTDFPMARVDPSSKMVLKGGKSYLFSDLLVGQLNYVFPEVAGLAIDLQGFYRQYNGEDLNGKKLLVWRHGGIGDLMFIMPCLRLLKQKYPQSELWIAIGKKYFPVYKNVKYVDVVYELPLEFEFFQKADYHLHFEQIIEGSKAAEHVNAYDLFLDRFHINSSEVPNKEKKADIYLTTEEMQFAEKFMDTHFKDIPIVVGVQIASSTPVRTFPFQRLYMLCEELAKRGIGLLLFGGDYQTQHGHAICNGIAELGTVTINGKSISTKSLVVSGAGVFDLRKTFAVTRHVDCVVACDSAMVHIAGAMGVPVVGLYGPFLSHLRMRYYSNAIGLNAKTPCAPCFIHTHTPCPKGAPSPCFSTIDIGLILLSIDKLLKAKQNIELPNMQQFRQNKFQSKIETLKHYMTGKGLDLGCGFTQYPPDISVKRVDLDPMCDPDHLGDLRGLAPVKGSELDFVISSFVVKRPEELTELLTVASRSIKPGGYFILYYADQAFCSKLDTDSGLMSHFERSYILSDLSEIDLERIPKFGFELVEKHLPGSSDALMTDFNVFTTEYGILTVWRRNNEEVRCGEGSPTIGPSLEDRPKP